MQGESMGYFFPSDFEERVGFAPVRAAIAELALSPLGRRGVAESQFRTDRGSIEVELARLHEMKSLLLMGTGFPSEGYIDMTAALPLLKQPEHWFAVEELHHLRLSLEAVDEIVRYFANHDEAVQLQSLAANVDLPPDVLREIGRVLTSAGDMRDDASPELLEVRRAMARREGKIAQRMQHLLAEAQRDGLLSSEAQVMVREGRPVLPVPAGSKGRFTGVVQGRSATGQTLFIEPLEVLELQQEIRELEAREQEEMVRILLAVTDLFRPYYVELQGCYIFLGAVDTLRAKALYAIRVGGARPIVVEEPRLYLRQAHHPLLYARLRSEGRASVPLDLELTPEQRILVISGPNAGGKSVCLKCCAVAVYMMQCGFLPFVLENSEMGIFSSILLDIGDAQSIEGDLSTYSSHLVSIRTFLARASARSLCLLDELGSGTEPIAGGAMAQAFLEALAESGTYGVVTTHYANLKTLAATLPGLRSGAMRYDLQRLEPLYELEMDMLGSSFAFEIARKLSLPQELVVRAEEIAGSDYVNLETQLRAAARDRRYWERKRQDIRRLERDVESLRAKLELALGDVTAQQKEILREARAEAKALLKESNRRIERTIREIRESGAARERTRELRGELRDFQASLESQEEVQTSSSAGASPGGQLPQQGLSVGTPVRLVGSATVGEVVSVEGERAVVALGQMLTTVDVARLEVVSGGEYRKARRAKRGSAADALRQRRLDFRSDMDVRGMRGEEALVAVESLLDDALLVGVSRVRILHGKGDGILRSRIRELLRDMPVVAHFADESETMGGAGITVVDLRG